jgi:nicotinamidase-related amidase
MEEKINTVYKVVQGLLGEIIPEETALIIVDMQKYQVKKGYATYNSLEKLASGVMDYFINEVERRVIPNIRDLIHFCHEVGITVIYTKFSSFMPDGSDFSRNIKTLNHTTKTLIGENGFPYILSPNSDIIDELKPEEEDFVLQKNTSGAFISTRLDSFLRNMGIETVLVSGVVTNFCVHSTAREAVDYGFQTVIVEDCCAAWSEEIHTSILKSFGLIYGYILPYKKLIRRVSRTMKKSVKELATY